MVWRASRRLSSSSRAEPLIDFLSRVRAVSCLSTMRGLRSARPVRTSPAVGDQGGVCGESVRCFRAYAHDPAHHVCAAVEPHGEHVVGCETGRLPRFHDSSLYFATKLALSMSSESLRLELAPFCIATALVGLDRFHTTSAIPAPCRTMIWPVV